MAHPNVHIAFSPWRLGLHQYAQEQEAQEREELERQALESQRLARERTLEPAVLAEFYRYKPIQGYNSSRVLVLKPGKNTDKLAGRLEYLWIGGEGPRYSALSYVWGEPQSNDVILIDGKRLAITSSLSLALRRLRPAPGQSALRIWVDQICINQRDTVERNQQVRLMHAIFRDANRVLVWLGADPEGDAPRAFQLANALRAIFEDKLLSSLCKSKGADLDWIPVENWKSLRELSKLPWFRRAWIPQEIGTDAEAIVHWGSDSIQWEKLHHSMRKLETHGWELKKKHKIDTGSATQLFRRFVEQPRDKPGGRARHSFIYQLCLSARNSATDPRDYVFSQLGHYSAWIETEQALIIQPDYDNTIAAVYHEIAIRALTVDSSLMLLNAVSDNGESSPPLPGPKALPSWVPRWDAGRFHSLIGYPGRYQAFGSTKSRITKDSFEDNFDTLVIKGIVVDTIDKVTAKFTPRCFSPESSKKELIQTAWRLCQPPSPRPVAGQPSKREPSSLKFTTQGTYQNDASFPPLKAFLDALAPSAVFSHISSPSSSSPTSLDIAYASGIAVLSKLFPAAAFSTKHDPRKSPNSEATPTDYKPPQPNPTTWLQAAEDHAVHRCFAVTKESRYFAMVPPTTKTGDILCILKGGETPYVLRVDPKAADKRLFVGEAYVPGLMKDASGLFGPGMELGTFRLR
ncbi:heterokaryon incompatibility protein-domain-containing protein [Staphylotrichum tortipilum]|uniref:Heterokaryon incompatibility protein-domain-containing protein n=1 Tax=Staphylotrichum tortipilum TaxID=2831512 RepID=A0AAN6RPA0_9PEZI|nr:heterokaryon incompatibility protein-domain-containing protein [Staphylotrichum longicolle]